MSKLNFTAQTARKRPIKPMPSKYLESPIRPNIEVGDGIRPHMPLIPLRYLDVKYQDITTEQHVVIPKGRIISAVTVQNATTGDPLKIQSSQADGDEGSVPVGQIDQTDGVSPLYVGADESYYGYTRDIAGLMVPANGGANRTITYDANDAAAGVPDDSTGAIVAPAATYVIPANAPIGVASYDVFQDIRGAHINYELYKSYGFVAEQHIKIPYVDYGVLRAEAAGVKFLNYINATQSGYRVTGAAAIDAVEDAGYVAAENKYSFLYFDSAEAPTAGLAGQLLVPDSFGNWVPSGAPADDNHANISLNATRTAQTIGRLLFCDTRFPRDLMETVEVPWGQRVAGTGTEGLTENLFDFIYTVLTAGGFSFGTTDPAKTAIDLVQKGAFGYAHIQLLAR